MMMILMMMVVMMMFVDLRTGGFIDPSTAGLAVVAAAILLEDHAAPKVARQLVQLFVQRHGLVQVGEELTEGLLRHD
jgi:hypothetical protein